ncbi:hypothetical protein [Nocardiopsis sp. L17-MgMaSL7]|nr:hypothetical protein [Nocardiopsis sp. L17-MgMaSL7]
MAEKVVDRLLAETARLGARELENPVQDRAHMVGLAARAIEGGMHPGTLWSIASVGLHNVRRQWALTGRLADPNGFAKVKQADFGGTTLGGPQVPMCGFHPQTALDGNGRCAQCAEADYQAALARGELQECTLGADGVWRDHKGTPLDSLYDFEGMTQAEIGQALEERERVRASLTGDAHKGATDAREALRKSRSSAALRALTAPESDEESQSGVPGAAGGS